MHELVYQFLQNTPADYALSRIGVDDGALLALFSPTTGPQRQPHPRWLAKTATGAAGCRRLRQEAWALEYLGPWSLDLNTPRLLGWKSEAGTRTETACLIQSGVAGHPSPATFNLGQPQRPLPAAFRAALLWLHRFQGTVAPPRATRLDEVSNRAREQAHAHLLAEPSLAPLSLPLLSLLTAEQDLASLPAVAIHGDFWSGNLLYTAPSATPGVVDWSGLDSGTALEDALTFWANAPCRGSAAAAPDPLVHQHPPSSWVGRWIHLFFSPATPRQALRDWAARVGYQPRTARLAFYLFLLRRLGWEMGFGLQTRSPEEREDARRHWSLLLAWLAQHHFPDPFSTVLAAEVGKGI